MKCLGRAGQQSLLNQYPGNKLLPGLIGENGCPLNLLFLVRHGIHECDIIIGINRKKTIHDHS